MQIFVNGTETEIAEQSSVHELVQLLDLADQRIAIEVNEELVPRSTFTRHHLQAGDQVEIVNAIGGG